MGFVETSGHDCPEPVFEFKEEMMGKQLCANLTRLHYTRPTPVQKYGIPIVAGDRDLMACAQTGSGKTGGFLFPIISQMLKKGPLDTASFGGHGGGRRPRIYPTATVLAPTRELASQIHDEGRKIDAVQKKAQPDQEESELRRLLGLLDRIKRVLPVSEPEPFSVVLPVEKSAAIEAHEASHVVALWANEGRAAASVVHHAVAAAAEAQGFRQD